MTRLLTLCLFFAACGSDPPSMGDGTDTGDATSPSDGGPTSDVGGQADLSSPTDAGTSPDAGDANIDPGPAGPTRYLAGPVLQPITESVVQSMRAIRARANTPADDVFIKVGASGTVNLANLTCFGPTSSYRVDLAGRPELQPTIDHFNARAFGGQTSWDRTTLAAEVGRSASWAISGSPSPLDAEVTALNPRFALVNYGTNDMQLGTSHATALWPFIDNLRTLLESLTTRGIIPIVTGLNPRSDSATAALWVPSYDAATRALAEEMQLPFVDLYLAVKDLPQMGLIADGIHGNAYTEGGAQPCVFSDAGLQYNYNVRNLATLRLLQDVTRTVLDGDAAPGTNPRPWSGTGSTVDPVVVDSLPFSHHADTATGGESVRDRYPACDSGQDESGPEVVYELRLDAPTALRAMVFDRGEADIDIHLLQGDTCLERHDRMLQGTYGPGDYTLVADTFVSASNGPRRGAFSLVVLACEPNDPDC